MMQQNLFETTEQPENSASGVPLDRLVSKIKPREANKTYNIIYADPPWNYSGDIYNRGGCEQHYNSMTTSEIARIGIDKICNWDAICFMWATFPKLQDAMYVLRHWGFEYKTVAFTWVKLNKKAKTPFFGMGKWTRSNAEICLMGVRNQIKRVEKNVSQVVVSDILKHSEKPNEVRERIVRLCGDIPRIELFARARHEGWDVWGNEVSSDIDLSC